MVEHSTKKLALKIKNEGDLRELVKSLSTERYFLLKAIKDFDPQSIYQLATLVNKSQPYVQKEIKYLAELGLVAFKKSKTDGRAKLIPYLPYVSLQIEIHL